MAKKSKPKKLITLDTETYNGLLGDLKRIAIYDGYDITRGYKFADIEPKINEWSDKGYDVHIYIHNLEFDLRKIPEVLNIKNVKWNSTKLINGKYVVVSCKKYTLHDSWRLLPMSLRKLSQDFDLKHGKLDLWDEVQKVYPGEYTDVVDFLDRCDVDDELFVRYLDYDVLSLYELINKLCDVSGIPFDELIRCMSTASLSKRIFKKGFKGVEFKTDTFEKTDFQYLTKNKWWSTTAEIKQNHSNEPLTYIELENKIRESYFGGRTEVFKPHLKDNGDIAGFHMDVNSLYPSQMIDNEFPISAPEFFTDPEDINFKFNCWMRHHTGLGFIKCIVYIPKCEIPPLPVKVGKLVFPCGYIEGTWTYNELEHAIKKYDVKIIKYKEMIHFAETFKIFKNLISVFSEIKAQAKEDNNNALYTLSKLIMNTSYGWTALRRDDKTELKDISKKEKYEDRIVNEDKELGFIEIISDVITDSIQVQVASYVTSYARLVLLEAFEKLKEQGATIYYCDTDSIVSDMLLPEEMLHESKLGLWDVEGVLTEGIFIQPKVYYESVDNKQKIKFKGVSKETQQTFDRKFIIKLYNKLAEGKDAEMVVEENKEILRSIKYMQKKELDFNYFEIRDKKIYLLNQQKRIMNYNENYTEPHYLKSIEEFYNFDLSPNLDPFRDENGNIFNPIM